MTQRNAAKILTRFESFTGKNADQTTLYDVISYITRNKQVKSGNTYKTTDKLLGKGTQNTDKANLKVFFHWLSKQSCYSKARREEFRAIYDADELKVASFNVKLDPKKFLDEREMLKILEQATNPRDKALLSLIFDVGCEAKSYQTLNIEDIECDGDRVFVNFQRKRRGS